MRVVIRGGGDLGSGIAVRLRRCGLDIVILETDAPLAVRRAVAFSEAVYAGEQRVEGVRGVLTSAAGVAAAFRAGDIPVLVDAEAHLLPELRADAVVDAVVAKRNVGTHRGMAATVVGVGPGFHAGVDVHAVVETQRGPRLGRVLWTGSAEPDTGVPGPVEGRGAERVLRAPRDGAVSAVRGIGEVVAAGDVVAQVAGAPVTAPFDSVVRGLLREGTRVRAGLKIGDLDPRLDPALAYLVSDKALAVAGGVLEAILARGDRLAHDGP